MRNCIAWHAGTWAGNVRVSLSHAGKAVRVRTIHGRRGTNHVKLASLQPGQRYTVSVVASNILRRTIG